MKFLKDKHGIVRDSSIYWFGDTKCDIFENELGMFAVVKEEKRPDLYEYRYGSAMVNGGQWEYVRTYSSAMSGRVGMLRRAARYVNVTAREVL